MALGVYSPENVVATIAGLYIISGYADGTFINISKITSIYTARESADGKVSRSLYKSGAYSVTFTLHQASESNQALAYIARLDEITQAGTFPLLIKDVSGDSIFFSSEAWISSLPDATYSVTGETREWMITATNVSYTPGGNQDQSDMLEDLFNVGSGYISNLF